MDMDASEVYAVVAELNAAERNKEALEAFISEETGLIKTLSEMEQHVLGSGAQGKGPTGHANQHTALMALINAMQDIEERMTQLQLEVSMSFTHRRGGDRRQHGGDEPEMTAKEMDRNIAQSRRKIAQWIGERDKLQDKTDVLQREQEGLQAQQVSETALQTLGSGRRLAAGSVDASNSTAYTIRRLDEQIAATEASCLTLTKLLSIPQPAALGY